MNAMKGLSHIPFNYNRGETILKRLTVKFMERSKLKNKNASETNKKK